MFARYKNKTKMSGEVGTLRKITIVNKGGAEGTTSGSKIEAEARAPSCKKFALLPKTRRDMNQ